MVEYSLLPNEITGEPDIYRAQVINSRSYDFKAIAERLLERNAGMSRSSISGVWEGIKDVVKEIILDGGSVNTELFQINASIRGNFNGLDDGFDSSRHMVRLNLKPGRLLSTTRKDLTVKKHNPGVKAFIIGVKDIKTGNVNSSLTPGKNVKISGQRLKITGTDPTCGLYFVSDKIQEEPLRVDPSEFVVNTPSQIIVEIPKLHKGNWTIRLITQFSSGSYFLKKPQIVTYNKPLSVI